MTGTDSTKCGFVAIVGRPNVGKSTLLNTLVGEKVTIVSNIPQTTRNQVRGIYTDERGQIIFIDTPGLHVGRDRLDEFMNSSAYGTTTEVDAIIHTVDVREPVGPEEEDIVSRIRSLSIPVVVALNKVDVTDKFIPEYISLWERCVGKPVVEIKGLTLLPLSGKKQINTDKLLTLLFELMPAGPMLYPQDAVSDTPQRMMMADVIREKLLGVLRDEVPHALAVLIEDVRPKKGKTLHVRALCLVERDTQKKIVIGKNGENLKNAGSLARQELESVLDQKVFLEIFVKTKRNWRDNVPLLTEMGYQQI